MTKKQMRIMLGYNAYFTADSVLEVERFVHLFDQKHCPLF